MAEVEQQQRNSENQRPVSPQLNTPAIPPLKINMTSRSILWKDKETHETHLVVQKKAKDSWNKLTEAIQNYKVNQNQPGLQAIALVDAKRHMSAVKYDIQPILTDYEKKNNDAVEAINGLHSKAATTIKQYSGKDGEEIRQTIRSMSKDQITKVVKKGATALSPEIWASIAESPAAALFLTKAQQNQARSNVIHAIFPEFPELQNQQSTAEMEHESITHQLQNVSSTIEGGINQLTQRHPGAFTNLNHHS